MPVSLGGTVYIGRDNPLEWRLHEAGQVLAADRAAAIDRAVLVLDAIATVDSAVEPSLVTGLGTDTLSWRLGSLPGLAGRAGQVVVARLVLYTPDYPGGLVWVDGVRVEVR